MSFGMQFLVVLFGCCFLVCFYYVWREVASINDKLSLLKSEVSCFKNSVRDDAYSLRATVRAMANCTLEMEKAISGRKNSLAAKKRGRPKKDKE